MSKASHAVAVRLRDRFFRTKWLVVLVAVVVLIFFGRTSDNKTLTQSALVIGLGIERTESAFNVSTLSVIVSGGSGGDNQQNYAVYSAEGATISEGLDHISQKMGLIVSLSHCNVVVLSPGVFDTDHALLFDPLISAYSLPEQAAVTSTEQPPSDILAARVGTTVASTYFVQASLLQNLGGDGIALVTVKDFLANSLSRSASVNIPLIDMKEMEHQPESQQGESQGNYELFMNRNLVVHGGDYFVLEEDLAQVTTMLVRKNDVLGRLSVTLPGGEAVEFRVLDVSPKTEADGMNVTASLEVSVSFLEAQNTSGGKITPSDDLVKRAAEQAANDLRKRLYECHALSLEKDADFCSCKTRSTKRRATPSPKTASATSASPVPFP